MSIFSKIGLVHQSKPCTQIYLQKNCDWSFKKSHLSDMHYPLTDIQVDFEINEIYFHGNKLFPQTDGRMDGRTDGTTDGRTSRTTTIGVFFEKKILKNQDIHKPIYIA